MSKELKKLEVLKKLIKGVVKGYSHSLVVVSPAGHGKTETTIKALEQEGLREGREYLYINSYITPLEFYKQLEQVNELSEPKILVMDDCEDIFNNVKMLSLLRGALWQLPNGLRKVSWFSTSSKIENKSFYFQGRIILLLNRLNRTNPLINAVADRGFYYEFELTNLEIIELIKKKSKEPFDGLTSKQRQKIVQFLEKVGQTSERLSLRILSQAYRLYQLSPNHWQQLLLKLLKP
ncbi:MAG: hypothetical protein ACTSR2_00785 [Candidatus Hodarchaeales archaeon]